MVKNRFYSHIKKQYDINKNELKTKSKKLKKNPLGKNKSKFKTEEFEPKIKKKNKR